MMKVVDNQRLDFGMYVAKRTETEIWFRGYGPDPFVCKLEAPAFFGHCPCDKFTG